MQGADYTSMGSFGNAESFGENLVASLDRSFLLRTGFNRPRSVQVTHCSKGHLDERIRSWGTCS